VTKTIGNYQVIRQLGEGHYGTVFLAVGEVPARGPKPPRRRLVAIKTLREDADSDAMELLTQEFALLDQVKHRGVVRVFEYLQDENAVVMEYIHGVSLRDVLDALMRKKEQIFTEAVIEIGIEVADALYQAFTTPSDNGNPLQLVHRDLKPANIMLTPQGEVKVLDFGLARVDNADFARDNPDRIRGTPIYMAPEQARGEEVGHGTDLFALGLILYELLMKQAAYRVSMEAADPVEAVFQAIEKGDVHQQCGELERRLPGLGPVVTRLLQSRPLDRYQDGQDLLVALRGQLYRDRGVYLREFCEFFFGPILAIDTAPKVEDFDDLGPVRREESKSTSAGRKRKSIGERLQASMSMDARAKKTLGLEEADKAVSVEDGSRSVSYTPPVTDKNPSRIKEVGKRRPDETGMMEMLPVGEAGADLRDVQGDPNSTQMIALNIPKGDRAKPVAPPVVRPGMSSGPPPPPGGPPSGAPPPPLRGASTHGGGPPPPPPTASSMVSAGNLGGGPRTPVATSGGVFQSTTGAGGRNPEEQRVQSNRVHAIVLGLIALVCLALILLRSGKTDEPMVKNSDEPALAINTKSDGPKDLKDTGGPPVRPPPATGPRPPPKTPATPGTAPPRPPKPPPGAGRGNVIVRLPDASHASGVELVCGGGSYRLRKSFSGGVASFSGVPGGSCTFFFKGGLPSQYTPVTAGRSYSCSVIGSTAVCK